MQVLILGSEGFIGQHLVRYFLSLEENVTGCDLYEIPSVKYNYYKVSRLSPEWENLFTGNAFDVCINASGSGNVNYSVTHPFADFEANTLDTIRVLDVIRRTNPGCKYLHLSSAAVYGNPVTLPIPESAVCSPLSPYGWHKLMSEQLCKEYSQLFGLKIAVARPFSIYGPGLRKQLFWDTYQKYINNPAQVELWGTGKESRDFIYVDDLVKCLHLVIQQGSMCGEVYNIASGTETYIADVVDNLFAHISNPPSIIFNNKTREGDPVNWRADISTITKIGFKQTVSLTEGLQKLATWLEYQNASNR